MFMTNPEQVVSAEQPSGSRSYLFSRVQEEAAAAADAASLEATIIHLKLATAYARRFNEGDGGAVDLLAQCWADEHRIW